MNTMFAAKVLRVLFVCFFGSCYCRQITHDVGIYGGHEITIDKAPYIVSIRDHEMEHGCGGSIISELFILTAAHCCVYLDLHKVRVGTDVLNGDGELYDIDEIIAHENFIFDFDVCLLKLSTPLTFGPNVTAISLADDKIELPVDTIVNATGWGTTESLFSFSSQLMQVAMPVVDHVLCQLVLKPFIITTNMICAGKTGVDTCKGDSGGPLTKGNVQVGITSFGRGCGRTPGVYTKVSTVLPWIRKTIEENN